MVAGNSLSIPQIHQPRNDRPGFAEISMLTSICLLHNPKNLTPSIDMLNRNAYLRQFPIVSPLLRRQRPVPRLLDGRHTVGIELQNPLITRISVFLQFFHDPQLALFQKRKIMHPPFATDDQENFKRLQADNELGFG